MAIRTVVTRGYGNGTFNGTIALVVVRGYLGTGVTSGTRRQRAIASLTRKRRKRC